MGEFIPDFVSDVRNISKLENFQVTTSSLGIGRYLNVTSSYFPANFVQQLWIEWCEQLSEFNEKFYVWNSSSSVGFVTIFVRDTFTISTLVEHVSQFNQLRLFVFVSGPQLTQTEHFHVVESSLKSGGTENTMEHLHEMNSETISVDTQLPHQNNSLKPNSASLSYKLRDERLNELNRLVEFLIAFEPEIKFKRRIACNCVDCITSVVSW